MHAFGTYIKDRRTCSDSFFKAEKVKKMHAQNLTPLSKSKHAKNCNSSDLICILQNVLCLHILNGINSAYFIHTSKNYQYTTLYVQLAMTRLAWEQQ